MISERQRKSVAAWKGWNDPAPQAPAPVVNLSPPVSNRPASNDPKLKARARSKWMSTHIALELAALNSPLKAAYLRTLDCASTITKVNDKLTSAYCGNRWCLVCSRIRTGKLMNSYLKLSEGLKDKHFVTLTVRNVTTAGRSEGEIIKELKYYQQKMYAWARKTLDGFRKYNLHYQGIRNFENKPSEDKKGFRPHIHWMIDGQCDLVTIEDIWRRKKLSVSKWVDLQIQLEKKQITAGHIKGELLIQLWLKEFKGVTDRRGQDVRKCTPGTEKELFKYETKFTVGKGSEKEIPVRMLDIIYRATKSVRTINVTGFITRKPTKPKRGTLEAEVRNNIVKVINSMIIDKLDKLDPDLFEKFNIAVATHDNIVSAADFERIYNLQLINYENKIKQWDIYRELTGKLAEPVTEDLEAQDYAGEILYDAYTWCEDNWYSVNSNQALVKWTLAKRYINFVQLFNSA